MAEEKKNLNLKDLEKVAGGDIWGEVRGVACPKCGSYNIEVLDSDVDGGHDLCKCEKCGHEFRL